jgi:predicted XRE-type DNA-binding protein
MTQPAADGFGDVYELTLAGSVGPVLCEAFRPFGISQAHVCTVLHVERPRGTDLVDLMAQLDAHGLQVELIAGTT